jgi:hypothetical protein
MLAEESKIHSAADNNEAANAAPIFLQSQESKQVASSNRRIIH